MEMLSDDGLKNKNVTSRIINHRADYEQSGWPIFNVADGNPETGWGVGPKGN